MQRGLDFADAGKLFEGRTITIVDDRFDYGEERFVSYGRIDGVGIALVWTDAKERAGSSRCGACTNGRWFMSDWIDPDDAPELTAEIAARGEVRVGGKLIRPASGTVTRGRPSLGERAKHQVTLRLDPDVIEKFRASGPGWQSRINAALREAVGL